MKKRHKRLLCGLLSVGLASTLVAEHTLRINASETTLGELLSSTAVTDSNVSFKDVTGSIDTSALRESQLNDSVLKNTETTPTYETRTVIITLTGDSLSESSDMPVTSYLNTFSGQTRLAEIRREQNAFLSALKKEGIPFTEEERYDTLLNGVAVELNTKYVSHIKQMQGVESVVITSSYAEPETITTSSSQEVFNLTSVYDTGIYDTTDFTHVAADGEVSHIDYGEGTVIAILDTGLDYTHEAFQRQPDNPAWSKDTVTGKLSTLSLRAEERSSGLETKDVYVSSKIPFAYDYADDDADVYPSYSNHGTHVAGIIGGYTTADVGYTDKEGNDINDEFRSVVPDCQLVICKVFTDDLEDKDLGGATPEDIVAALEDCVKLDVDVINMSLGTSCGFSTTNDGDDEGEMLNNVYTEIQKQGISLVCAASNDFSSGFGGVFGTNLKQNPDSSTVGSPSTFSASLSVASISGQESPYLIANGSDFIFFEESRDENSNPFDFVTQMLGDEKNSDGTYKVTEQEFEYLVIPGIGDMGHYTSAIREQLKKNPNTIVLVKRGDTTFQEKVQMANRMGAKAIMVYNNVAGVIRMNLGEIDEANRIPAISINMDAGNTLIDATRDANGNLPTVAVGTIVISRDNTAGPFMSEFSSWGPTHDLKIKPEITAHGGEITSTVPGGYGEQSGTSMASPNMAGVMAIIRNYIENTDATRKLVTNEDGTINNVIVNRLANQLIMSTATTVRDQKGLPYSPRKQGAGLGSLDNVINHTSAYLWVDNAENDYRPKLEIGDDPSKSGIISKEKLTFKVTNFGDSTLEFKPNHMLFTETVSADGLAIAEQAYMLDDNAADWYVGTEDDMDKLGHNDTITVSAGETVTVSVELSLSEKELEYMGEENFPNGMYLEGFLKLTPTEDSANQCELSLPFLGFHGDWEGSDMLDYSAYEVAADEADASLDDSEKKQASVWATQPYSIYYNEKYILPMGSYVYIIDEDNEDPVYTDEKYNAISRYNIYYGEGEAKNYLTSTGIKAVYAGLLRNARVVTYTLTNVETGEKILIDQEIPRVGKAYAGGGSAVPANVEFELYPEELGLLSNGVYQMDFVFYMNDPETNTVFADDPDLDADANPDNMRGYYSFTFTVDYEAPVLEDARIRYKTVKDSSGKESQQIYLDLDIYDNHYAQAVMLCYPTKNSNDQLVLELATEYATPVRSEVKNSTSTVSIEITDIYEQYGNQFYVQIDDYAENNCLYQLDLDDLHIGQLPANGEFSLAEGEENITLNIYETHKVSLQYTGSADLSNFSWTTNADQVASVKNGEIVGLSAGEAIITVSNRQGDVETIHVTVTEDKKGLSDPSISFGIIKTADKALVKAEGMVEVNAGQSFNIQVITDPWYHPMTGLNVRWTSSDPGVATVDQEGNVVTLKKGLTAIEAQIYRGDVPTLNKATVTLEVVNEFEVSNYVLQGYNGVGYTVDEEKGYTAEDGILWIPTDMNIMTIGENAFKDNNTIKKIVIPASVTQIQEGAFENCSALEEVYFVDVNHRETIVNGVKVVNSDIDWADLTLIFEEAFKDCENLRKIDFTNTKTFTIAQDCFVGCTSLSEIVQMSNIGTMYHGAFKGCTGLTEVDISGTFVMGDNVFENCTSITSVVTGRFTDVGKEAFKGCTGLRNLTLYTPHIGEGAFSGCVNLRKVTLDSPADLPADVTLEFYIGNRAFENCGTNVTSGFSIDFGDEVIKTIGKNAFAGSDLTKIAINDSFDVDALRLGGTSFENITVTLADGYDGVLYAEENGVIYNANKTKILLVNTSLSSEFEIPATVTEIGSYAFANSKLSTVTFANAANITAMGEGAFYNTKLQSLDLTGVRVSAIPAYAFYQSRISSLVLPTSVTDIGDYAFAYSAIHTAYLPSVERVGDYAFERCDSILKVTTGSAADTAAIVFGDTLTALGSGAFYACSNLQSVVLPSLTKLGVESVDDETSMIDRISLGAFASCGKLTSAQLGVDTTATGVYTFALSGLQSFVFADGQYVIGEGMFYACDDLTSVTLSTIVQVQIGDTIIYNTVGAGAFAYCDSLTTVNNLDKAVLIQSQAFYNTSLTALTLTSAKEIGRGAFALEGEEGEEAAYTVVEMPNVESIAAYAFLNGGESVVDLPASVKEIGYGAFASSKNLVGFTVAADNPTFMVFDTDSNGYGVLYRYIDKATGSYEIVCYPANRVQAAEEGKKVYTIAEGTVYVLSAAFYAINEDALDGVVLPHSVNAIGDDAFFNSGIKEYTFESVQAPLLETIYHAEVAGWIESIAEENTVSYYKGYYYTNFDSYFYNYTHFGNETSDLKLYYPQNGIGYDNYVYRLYFGTKATTTIVQTDATREFIRTLEGLSLDKITGWATADKADEEIKAEVVACSNLIKELRTNYDLLCKDSTQASFVQDKKSELLAVEEAIRAAKANYDIKVEIEDVLFNWDTIKKSYVVGERFQMTGMEITIVYEDNSTQIMDLQYLSLLPEYDVPLALNNYYVMLRYDDGENVYDFRISISVQNAATTPEEPSDTDEVPTAEPEETGSSWMVWVFVGVGAALVVGGVTALLLIKRKKKLATAQPSTDETQTDAESVENAPTDDNA